MFPASTRRLRGGGLVVAAVGFLLTRYTVLESLRPDASLVVFVLSDMPVLVAGLGLTAFGVGLAMSSRDPEETLVVATWCLLGTAAMGAVVGLTYATVWPVALSTAESRLITNALVGGAVGGTFTGIRSAGTRRHRRDLSRQTNRLTVLNRLLRHEVLNKANVIEGYASIGAEADDEGTSTDRWDTIRRHADAIDDTIDVVGLLTESRESHPVELRPHVETAVDAVRTEHPSAVIDVDDLPDGTVRGTDHLHLLFEHLIENAVVHNDRSTPEVRVTAETDGPTDSVRVRIFDDGPGLPAKQQRVVVDRMTPEHDDPSSGFGLTLVRLVLDDIEADIDVETPVADGRGTELTLEFRDPAASDGRLGVAPAHLKRGAAAGLIAGVAMGLPTQFVTGRMDVIGALYGVDNVPVGWITHQYHSVFFALLFVVATVTWLRDDDWWTTTLLGGGYGVFLWFVAAGVVMPLWLRAVGVPAPVPNLNVPSLATHVLWGVVLGGVYGWLRRRWRRRVRDGGVAA
ncbi:ATP-binding protein [Haloplanus salilacus]|uniref:ATP-binding protein n=1 Tax=Haloplanus salilacus TaxID=2949994 RepID=UPI0030D44105